MRSAKARAALRHTPRGGRSIGQTDARRRQLCGTRSHGPHRAPIQKALFAVGVLLFAGAALVYGWQLWVRQSYVRLSRRARLSEAMVEEGPGSQIGPYEPIFDWDALQGQSPDLAGWIRIEGTSIDLPVVKTRSGDADYYLNHDLWGHWALEGTPFLDHRCEADDMRRLVYGHHLATGGQFSELQKAYRQEVFDQLDRCHWSTPASGQTQALPLFALKVDERYEPIQHFGPLSNEALKAWLMELEGDVTARSVQWEQLIEQAASVVTCVTCSSDASGARWRTLVIFVELQA